MNRESETVRRRLPAAERRELIIEAAGRAFGERGYEGARLDEIAAAAGVTKPILYRHFGSKQELYLALLDRHRDDLPTFGERMPTEGSPSERLRAVLELWLDYVESHSYAWQMIFRDTGGGVPIEASRRELNARAREVLAAIIRGLGPRDSPPRGPSPGRADEHGHGLGRALVDGDARGLAWRGARRAHPRLERSAELA